MKHAIRRAVQVQRVEYTTNPLLEGLPKIEDVVFPISGVGMPAKQVEGAARFRVKIMRELGCLKDWINAVSDPNIIIDDPIELKMIDNILENGDA